MDTDLDQIHALVESVQPNHQMQFVADIAPNMAYSLCPGRLEVLSACAGVMLMSYIGIGMRICPGSPFFNQYLSPMTIKNSYIFPYLSNFL